AYGLLAADEKRDAVRTYQRSLDAVDPDDVDAVYEALAEELLAEVSDREAATRYKREVRETKQENERRQRQDAPMVGDDFVDAREITRAEAKRRTRIRELKQRVVDQTPGLDSTQNVRVRRDGNRLVASLTTIGQHNVRDYQVEQQRNA
ncbi:hypothetical protein DVK03_19530, partial [Haloferax sp. Atlit-109R]